MLLDRIHALLDTCVTDTPLFRPTLLYNEGWLLRLILDWYATHPVIDGPLTFAADAVWYSEALLPSAFLPQRRADRRGESHTNADGVIGHFTIGLGSKAGLTLAPAATQLVVCEAKLSSGFSASVKNAPGFDQAARSVACIAEILQRAGRAPGAMDSLGLVVLAPAARIAKGVFAAAMDRESIRNKVAQRVQTYGGGLDTWYERWFEPTLARIALATLSWEDRIEAIRAADSLAADALDAFYQRCQEFNGLSLAH